MSVLAVAHRAGNSLEALHAAVEAGAHVLEADIHAHRGRLEVRHHKSAGPLPWLWDRKRHGRVPLLHDRWHFVHTSVPQLQLHEMMEAARGARTVMLDLKGIGGVGPAVVRELHRQVPEVPLLVCGRWWPSVDAFAGVDWARPVLSARGRAELFRLRRRLRGDRRPYGVSLHRSLLGADLVAELHDSVELVMTWPVNDTGALEDVLRLGVTGVITDETDVLQAVLALA
jgi:glycerophosphoryl diester phosphodiesterase